MICAYRRLFGIALRCLRNKQLLRWVLALLPEFGCRVRHEFREPGLLTCDRGIGENFCSRDFAAVIGPSFASCIARAMPNSDELHIDETGRRFDAILMRGGYWQHGDYQWDSKST